MIEAFAVAHLDLRIQSITRPGLPSGKLLDIFKEPAFQAELSLHGPFDDILLLPGVNDVVQRLGAIQYARHVSALAKEASQQALRVWVLSIPRFNEDADISGVAGRIKHRLSGLVFDRGGNRIDRYHDALRACRGQFSIIDADAFIPAYDPSHFKDGIHLTDEAFRRLAFRVGEQIAAAGDRASGSGTI